MGQPQADYEIEIDPDEFEPAPTPEAIIAARQQAAELAASAASADRELAVVQAESARDDGMTVVEGKVSPADESSSVEFMGRRFRVADKIGLMPLLKFSSASSMSTADPRALAAIYEMLRDSIHQGSPGCGSCEHCKTGNEGRCASFDPGDWQDFEEHATTTKADAEELFDVINKVMEIIAGRPTKQSGGSSNGRARTRGASTGNSSGRRARASRR